MATIQTASNRIQVLEIIGNAIVGGMETCVLRLIEKLPADRFGVTAMVPHECPLADQLRALGADVVIAPLPENPTWSSIQLACALVKAHAVDVLHAHMPNAHVLAGLVGKLTGKPVLGTIHGRQLTPTDLEVHRTAATHLSVVCRQTYFHALGLGVNPSQLHFIPNGVDVDVFAPRARTRHRLRDPLGLSAQTPLIGFVGRLSPEKGPDVFLRAAVALKQSLPDAHFVVVGEGPMFGELTDFVRRFELGDSVHLVGLKSDIPELLSELDVVVSTSHSEAMPLALMEAMASGLPVVATRVGGVPELIQHGVTGWLVGDGDFDAVASRVKMLVQNPQARADMGQRARERAVERLSLDDSVDTTMQLLTRLSQRASEPRRVTAVASTPKTLLNGSASAGNGASASGKAASA